MMPHLRLFVPLRGPQVRETAGVAAGVGSACEDGAVSEQPGRYQRSTSGLLASILVTLLAIGAFVGVRALVREDAAQDPEPVDYLAAVGQAQEAGVDVVYPSAVPEGWIATSVDLTQGDRPAWGLGMLTDDGRFVGLRQEDGSVDDLLETYVDEQATEVGETGLASPVASTWRVFEDDGGDRAYAAEVGDDVVLVYGSAPREDLELVVGRLTTAPR